MSLIIGVLLGVLSLLGYGFSDYFGTISSKKAGWFGSVTISRAVSFFVFLIILLAFFKLPALTATQVILLIVAGVLSNIGLQAFYKALQVGNLSIANPISNTGVAITVVLVLVFFGTTLGYVQGASILFIIAGTILASFKYKDLRRLDFRRFVAGSEFAALSAIVWGVDIFIEIILVKQLGWLVPAFFVYLVMMAYNLIYSGIFKVGLRKVRTAIVPIIMTGLTAALGFLAFNWGVVLNYAIIVTALSGATTLLTVLLGLVLLKEKLEPNQKLGVALMIISIFVLSLS